MVQETLKHDPHGGHLFVFRGRRGDLIKCLWSDGQGLCLFAKRLERGRFLWPSTADGTVTISTAVAEPISFELTMQRDGDNIRLFLKSSGHFRVGLTGFSTILGPSNTEQVQADLKKYGFEAISAPLSKFADSKVLNALFWNHDAPADIENLDTLFLNGGEETRKALSELKIDENSNIQTKSGLVLFFDRQNIPVLSAAIDYSVPVPK